MPVIDLKHGLVVRARMGDRASYAPIETPLSPSPEPLAIAAGLLALHPFRKLYIADLDGIEGRPRNDAAIDAIAARFPDLELWLDNGIADLASARDYTTAHRVRLVIGSESQQDASLPRALGSPPSTATTAAGAISAPEPVRSGVGAILSIDFRGETFIGPPALRDDPATWPDDVIAMTLARVGSGAGPDFETLSGLRARAGAAGRDVRIWAAGGVRDLADMARLATDGISGALVATALHDGRLDTAALAAIGRM
ncbi:HisA/HisF-related TIM barrel protein [Methyloraptor flagellatus]|uniref:HisA/HisF-related TIM barrel protein n=1 Tax=Methyloraptor flagellatus TaxID=3162530 RepID=A0AAU7XIF9_9HYPH